MRPTPIPDAEVWPGAVRRVISPPDGDLTNPDIAPVEALVDRSPATGAINLSVRCVLDDGELEALQAGGVVWLTFWGAMVPWAATVAAPIGEPAAGKDGRTASEVVEAFLASERERLLGRSDPTGLLNNWCGGILAAAEELRKVGR